MDELYIIFTDEQVWPSRKACMKPNGTLRMSVGAPSRNRTGTPLRARDFKSRVSTSFTIGAARQDSSTGVPERVKSARLYAPRPAPGLWSSHRMV